MGKGVGSLTIDLSTVVDEIYEAAVVPEKWIGVLDRMAAISGAEGTLLFAAGAERSHWMCSAALEPFVQTWISDGWIGRNTRGERLIPIREPRFLTDLDAFTREELDAEPYYTEFMRPLGFGWCVGTSIRSPTGDALVFTAERLWRNGPVERAAVDTLDGLRPHLARAALLSARVGLERARATVDALQVIGLPAVVLREKGRAVAANPNFEACAPRIAVGARDVVAFADCGAQAIFLEALGEAGGASTWRAGRSIAVPPGTDEPPLVAHLVPLRGAGLDLFSGASLVLFVTPVTAGKAPDVRLLEVLFDLTPAEARVSSLLVEGRTVEAIAAALAVTQNTVRMHLKSVFAKTGVHRQAQLVALLASPAYGRPSG